LQSLSLSIEQVHGKYQFAQYLDTNNTEDIGTFLNDAIVGNCEGLMIKTLETDATYEHSRRSYNWLKVKKDYLNGVTDSLDLVPIAVSFLFWLDFVVDGVLGSFLLACYDPDNEEYQSICKVSLILKKKKTY
jgi:DNA ligase 1